MYSCFASNGFTRRDVGLPAPTIRNRSTIVAFRPWIRSSGGVPAQHHDPPKAMRSGVCDILVCSPDSPIPHRRRRSRASSTRFHPRKQESLCHARYRATIVFLFLMYKLCGIVYCLRGCRKDIAGAVGGVVVVVTYFKCIEFILIVISFSFFL